jgi:hypothetical protein
VTKSTDRELLDLENQYWRAIQDGNVDALLRLTDDACVVTGAQGVASTDKQTLVQMLAEGPWQVNDFEIKPDAAVHLINDDVAIVAYRVHEKLTVDGQPVTLDAADASVWVRRGGRRVSALHTESILGDPFGRES